MAGDPRITNETFRALIDGVRRDVRTETVYRIDEVIVDGHGAYWVYRTVDTDEWITATHRDEMTPPFIEWLAGEGIQAELGSEDDEVCSVGRATSGQWYGWLGAVTRACESREAAVAWTIEFGHLLLRPPRPGEEITG